MWLQLTLAFTSGFIVDAFSVFWTHYAEKGKPGMAALCGVLIAGGICIGVGSSVQDWRLGAAYALGFGVGAYVAVLAKERFKRG